MRTGTADLPLHGGRAPTWLFKRARLRLAQQRADHDGMWRPEGGAAGSVSRNGSLHRRREGQGLPQRPTYDATIESLRRAVNDVRAGHSEKSAALRRLAGVERSLTCG